MINNNLNNINQQLVPLGNNTPQRQGISTTKIINNYSILTNIILLTT